MNQEISKRQFLFDYLMTMDIVTTLMDWRICRKGSHQPSSPLNPHMAFWSGCPLSVARNISGQGMQGHLDRGNWNVDLTPFNRYSTVP